MNAFIRAGSFVLAIVAGGYVGMASAQDKADQLVGSLRMFPAALPGIAPSNGKPDLNEERRRQVYSELRELDQQALPALIRGLADRDVQLRRNVALFLGTAAGEWYDPSQPRMNVQAALPALITSLTDSDDRVRELVAQVIGEIGPSAVAAVPALMKLLTDPSEGSRNSACLGLAGVGPAAKAALPALRKALSDKNPTVRRFAQRAIERIEDVSVRFQ